MTRSVSAMRILLALVTLAEICAAQYYGKDLGKLTELHHGVSGHVYAVDSKTLFIKDFTYDGEGPAAYFYVGSGREPAASGGARVRDERGAATPLRRYRTRDIVLPLPDGISLSNVRWFAVWCDDFSVNFGDVRIPKNFDVPKPQKTSALNGVHGVSSDVVIIVDAQTLLVPHFSYDGEAPDAKFWVGRGGKPSPQGIRIPDENGKEAPLRKYEQKTIVLSLPGDLTVFDIGHFGVWCEAFTVDFGHIRVPDKLNVPPSLKMLGVSPQKRNQALLATASPSSSTSKHQSNRGQSKFGTNQRDSLKPTTYRPHLAPIRTSSNLESNQRDPFEAPFNVNDARYQLTQSAIPSQVHRRADEFLTPKNQQHVNSEQQTKNENVERKPKTTLDIQPSMEIYYRTENVPQYYQNQYQQNAQNQPQLFVPRPVYLLQPQSLPHSPYTTNHFIQNAPDPIQYVNPQLYYQGFAGQSPTQRRDDLDLPVTQFHNGQRHFYPTVDGGQRFN